MNKVLVVPSLLFVLLFSSLSRASDYLYQAEVEGMVCAFCAYSVSKNISKLSGVDADSVDVDLKGGHVTFHSSQQIDETKLIALFSDSGFTISQLKTSDLELSHEATNKINQFEMTLKLEMNSDKLEQYKGLLEGIGDLVAGTNAYLLIEASGIDESSLLKPILMGRQQVIKVRFFDRSNEDDNVVIKLFVDAS